MTEPVAPPQLSPDGKFYWDGQKWVPMPAAAAPPAQAQQVRVSGVVRTAPARWRYVFWALIVGGILFIVTCSVLTSSHT